MCTLIQSELLTLPSPPLPSPRLPSPPLASPPPLPSPPFLPLTIYLLPCDSADRKTYLPEQRVKLYMYQLCKSIYHMHRNGIFHRDVKPENILVKVSMSQTVSLKQGFECPLPPPIPPSLPLLLFPPSFPFLPRTMC